LGEIITNKEAREYFSTDASVFKILPNVIIYPMHTTDVRKIVKFSYQLALKGKILPITARGMGTDQSGAAIGEGLLLVFPAHLNKLLELDTKSGEVRVEPGLNYGKLQQVLLTHDLFIPVSPASIEYSTIGGAIGNNAGGDRSVKYGKTLDYVKSLKVVLSNGDLIETRRISKKELNKKMGLSNFEGEIYRSIDRLIEENSHLINSMDIEVSKNSSGYNLKSVKRRDGSFDLTPLIVGSQGTLGIVTEATLLTMPRRPKTTLTIVSLSNISEVADTLEFIKKFSKVPSAIELVDDKLLNLVKNNHPNLLKNIFNDDFSRFVLIVEFDNPTERLRTSLTKKLTKYLQDNNLAFETSIDPVRIEEFWKFRRSTTAVLGHQEGAAKPLPIIEDGIVPVDKFADFIESLYFLFSQNDLPIYVYGHAGDGHLHLQPALDLSKVGDRQKVFKLMIEYYNLIKQFNGSISAEHGDGRIRAPFLYAQYGPQSYQLLTKVKSIFDPQGILNTGVKFTDDLESLKPILRDEYNLNYLYNYLPYL
ncbi:MAG TPA: FAD-binding oxidoreductase, partial [Candidatus Dormibacteraeota bacterium]|nr:FAD-binding oxidoreductase [Candidatus Dormibacteraeota bacterium]